MWCGGNYYIFFNDPVNILVSLVASFSGSYVGYDLKKITNVGLFCVRRPESLKASYVPNFGLNYKNAKA